MERVFFDALLYAMEGKDPSLAIENQEKREQKETVANHRLPKRINKHSVPDEYRRKGVTKNMDFKEEMKIIDQNNQEYTKEQYEKMGIKIIDEYDDLFFSVELPEGWEIKATDHSMWNNVFDDKGRKRISFFYKGAFYDRDAFSNFERRYGYKILPFDNYESDASYEERKFKPWRVFITDNGERIEMLKEIIPSTDKEYYEFDDILKIHAVKYLDEKYPNWSDINAYWD